MLTSFFDAMKGKLTVGKASVLQGRGVPQDPDLRRAVISERSPGAAAVITFQVSPGRGCSYSTKQKDEKTKRKKIKNGNR